jgi:FlaA1/EpsC-like NDP-sugar epimerase
MDCIILIVTGVATFLLNHGIVSVITEGQFYPLLATCILYLVCFIYPFRRYHTYSGVLRYSSFIDLKRIALAIAFGCITVMAVQWAFGLDRWLIHLYAPDILFSGVLSIFIMWSVRIIVKSLHDNFTIHTNQHRVFIYGTRSGGVSIAKSINTQENSPYKVVGFVADISDMVGKVLMGVPVYQNNETLTALMHKHKADTLFVSPLRSDSLRNNTEMVNQLIAANITIMMMPSAQEWNGTTDLSYTHLRPVKVEDLLPRDKIEIDMEAVGKLLSGKRILITGAAGSIGSEMVRQIAIFNPAELILIDQAETPLHDIRLMMARRWPAIKAKTIVADIANQRRMEEIFKQHCPEYVFHAAAYKHVPMMEDNPAESIENNVNGTRIIADLAVKYGTKKFVMVSTDKAVNPTNVMGCSKRICEIYVQALDKAIKDATVKGSTAFVTTRFGNVLGSNGSVIPLFEKQIKAGGPLTVTHPDIIRFFMLIPEACKLVLEAGTMGAGGEIFVFDMGQPVKIADLARRMIQMSGAKNIEIKFTGLRDGEKLYEEVLNDEEITLPTFHEKIKIAQVREYDYDDVNRRIGHLIELANNADDMTIVAEMKALVPEFRSQHSKYEALDAPRAKAPATTPA